MIIKVIFINLYLESGIILMCLGLGFYSLGTIMFFDRTLYIFANVLN
jgi:hypothetical protein